MTHTCVIELTIIGSDNGLSPGQRQAIIRTNAEILLIRPLRTSFSEILIEILIFSVKKIRLKVSSAKRRLFCLGLNVLRCNTFTYVFPTCHTHSRQQDVELDIQNITFIRTLDIIKPVSYTHQSFLDHVWQQCFCFNQIVKYQKQSCQIPLRPWQMWTLFNAQDPAQRASCFKYIIFKKFNDFVNIVRSLQFSPHMATEMIIHKGPASALGAQVVF